MNLASFWKLQLNAFLNVPRLALLSAYLRKRGKEKLVEDRANSHTRAHTHTKNERDFILFDEDRGRCGEREGERENNMCVIISISICERID